MPVRVSAAMDLDDRLAVANIGAGAGCARPGCLGARAAREQNRQREEDDGGRAAPHPGHTLRAASDERTITARNMSPPIRTSSGAAAEGHRLAPADRHCITRGITIPSAT